MENIKQLIEQWADAHETDPAIAAAICQIACDEDDAERIWREGTEAEVAAIVEIVTNNTLLTDDHRAMAWGVTTLGAIVGMGGLDS